MPLPPDAPEAYAQISFFRNNEVNKAKRSKAEIEEDEQKADALTDEQKVFVERNLSFVVARETQHLTKDECSFVKGNATAEEKWWARQNPPGVPPILELRKRFMGKILVGEEEHGDETVRWPLVDAVSFLSTKTTPWIDFSHDENEASLVANGDLIDFQTLGASSSPSSGARRDKCHVDCKEAKAPDDR